MTEADVQSVDRNLRSDACYARNMAALFRADPRLAQRLDELEPDGSVLLEPGRHGGVTAAVRTPGAGRPIQVHSRVDPEAEAGRFAESVEVGTNLCFVVHGFGLGYHVRALYRRLKGEEILVVAEPDLQLLKAAMETVDLAEVFADRRCVILTSEDRGDIQTRLEPYGTQMMLGTRFVSHPPSERLNGPFHAGIRRMLAEHMTANRMALVTLVANSRITCRNIINNLATYVAAPPIDILRDRFKGFPGVVVSAGPSLRRNIDLLGRLKGRAPIIAVQTTFKTLLDRGLVPDFVTSLDFHEISRRFFEDVADFSGTHLVAEPKVTWHVIDAYRGPVSLIGNDFARQLLGDALGFRPGLKAGATVAHLAFYLAVYMGCDPVVFVGQDLGYSNHVYYVPGVPFHDIWRPDLNRFCTIEMKEWERIARHRRLLMKVRDIHGHDIYTDEQLFTYLQQFEGDFAALPGRVIDATEGGVRKAHTQVMPLAEVIERHATRDIPPERFAYLRQTRWWDPSRLGPARDALDRRIDSLREVTDICRRMLEVLRELQGLIDEPHRFNRRLAEVDRLRREVRARADMYRLVSSVAQQAELQRFSADRRLALADVDSRDRARRQLDRDIRFVDAMLEGAGVLGEMLAEGRDRLTAAMEKTENSRP